MSAYTTWDITTFTADGVEIETYGVRAVGSLNKDMDLALSMARAKDACVMAVEVRPRSSKLMKMPGVEGILPVAVQVNYRRTSARVTVRG